MKINVSVVGRFHAFNLAAELENGFSWSDYGDRYSQNLEEIFSKHF
tara:strand:- start:480 stop:617 length:138 start_codon:yes stop_codon:yes gene_type:complete